MIRKLWHDPVGSKIISAMIVSGAGWAAIHFKLWSVVSKAVRSAVHWALASLVSTSPVPHWLIGVACLAVFVALLIGGALVVAAVEAKSVTKSLFAGISPPPDWHSYTTDIFYKVRWRWAYGQSGELTIPVCFCPRCDCQLVAHSLIQLPGFDRTAFYCPDCDRSTQEIAESLASIEQTVSLLIQRNIRNNSWIRRENPTGAEASNKHIS